jgi:CRISPR/Cas system-associated protein Csm6
MAELIDTFYEGIVELFKEDDDTAKSIQENGNVYPESNTNLS